MKNKKWTLAVWGYGLGTVLTLTGLFLVCFEKTGGLAVIVQGLGIITLIFGGYSAANVVQKNVISQNYQPGLAGQNITEEK